MLICPMCKKGLEDLAVECPRCRTDLSLLVDHVGHLRDGLAKADALTRRGELGEAVWAYLEVLEVDPDNPTARRQVGQVATAVRVFDRSVPGRRWLGRLRRQAAFRQWLASWQQGEAVGPWFRVVAAGVVLGTAFLIGLEVGRRREPLPSQESLPAMTPRENGQLPPEAPRLGAGKLRDD